MSNGEPQNGGAEKKGMTTLAKVGIGCAIVVTLVLIALGIAGTCLSGKIKDFAERAEQNPALAAAEVFTSLNRDIEIVEADDEDDTVTLRNKETGEELTVTLEDIKEGKISFSTDEGEVTISSDDDRDDGRIVVQGKDGETRIGPGGADELPDWVPVFPGSKIEGTFASSSGDNISGAYGFNSSQQPASICRYYQEALEDDGFELHRRTMTSDGESQIILTATDESTERQVTVAAMSGEKSTTVQVSYHGKQ